jgi:hypothetical protein
MFLRMRGLVQGLAQGPFAGLAYGLAPTPPGAGGGPVGDGLLTEGGDFLITESGEHIVTE